MHDTLTGALDSSGGHGGGRRRTEPTFLLRQYLAWVDPDYHGTVQAAWPPVAPPPSPAPAGAAKRKAAARRA